ncbi:hypothetical protein L218DRAFT_907740, partial [Marasmius fiardii PR-910]
MDSMEKEKPPALEPVKPTLRQSWDAIMKTVDALDGDQVKGYKEDIDTLLVFAGLFSAVVTAFTVESYQWLREDPQDSTVSLLKQISHWQMNGEPLPPDPPFTPLRSDIRINAFWFLSLILALVDALFGLLCKQWIREHQREANTHTPSQTLALRWLRYHSFERWHVPSILASLPILLELALFSFFVGLLELLWTRGHHIIFGIALGVTGLAALFYFVTTVLPSLNILHQVLHVHPYFFLGKIGKNILSFEADDILRLPQINIICPYKSPQSWLTLRLFMAVFRLPGITRLLQPFIMSNFKSRSEMLWHQDIYLFHSSMKKNIRDLSNWSSIDLNIIQRFSRVRDCPNFYEIKGFRWLVQETRDIPSMIPHLENVLAELPKHLVAPAIFDQW